MGGGFLTENAPAARGREAPPAGYDSPLLRIALDVPGGYGHFPLAERSFREGLKAVRLRLAAERIPVLREEILETADGFAAIIAAGAPPEMLEKILRRFEDGHPLGRLFDIEVFRRDGGAIFRVDRRGKKTPDAAAMLQFQRERLADQVAAAALRALVGEAAVTPKPGLVDRANNGAHRDMDFFSFIDSTASIIPFFRACALAGFDAAEIHPEKMMKLPHSDSGHPSALFGFLRPEGKIAELQMLEASNGANTHRGLIFSVGLASAAYGAFFRHQEQTAAGELLEFMAAMAYRITDDFAGGGNGCCGTGGLSHGESIHRHYGIGGIREEARLGFPAVRCHALPALRQSLKTGYGINDAGLAVFLRLLCVVTDTNIIHRSSPETLEEIRRDAAAFLEAEPGPAAMAEYTAKLDRDFTAKNISPGGCADLLALTLFLHRLCETGGHTPAKR
jgi:holo-ACP synthase/triphosphoribosyl-dephospho-CoA synthase